ncbi:MAG: GTP-binding protein [Patescibacteria group bacterium]|nr:GTP-binding protein [Patescibacteria group bacterium]
MPTQNKNPEPRPPIVAVMGHVDHGKTTLLDYIRKTNVAAREAGGITQSIGAYEIIHNGRKITFIDTPGHEAFSKMRGYGAKIADLAILVVAADDGVKPQTKDALKYILEAKIPFVVAINKADKTNANIEKTKQDLMQAGVFLEGSGGSVSWNIISAKLGTGIHELLDHLLLVSDVEGFSYDPKAEADGFILTCKLDPRRGIIVGVILCNGRLELNDLIQTKSASGKIKMLENFLGENTSPILPSSPAIIIGFENAPKIGEEFVAGKKLATRAKTILNKISKPANQTKDEKDETLKLILKANEVGSLEALEDLIHRISKEAPLKIIQSSIGNIHESDVKTAESTRALIIGFRAKADKAAINIARSQKTTIILSQIIYELEKSIKEYAAKTISKEMRTIEILAIFGAPKGKQKIIGGKVILGPIKNQESFEIWQDKKLFGTGRIINLQSQRQDITEAQTGQEVGLLIESEESIKTGNKLLFNNQLVNATL